MDKIPGNSIGHFLYKKDAMEAYSEVKQVEMVPFEDGHIMKNASKEEIKVMLERQRNLTRPLHVTMKFRHLSLWTMASEPTIQTVANAMTPGCFAASQKRYDILKDLNGRVAPFKMTLLLGPPGSGRSVFMKALSNRLTTSATLEGEVLFNGVHEKEGKFLVPKLVDYIEQGDYHAATLSVEETLKYAWMCTTGGHHSYAQAKDQDTKEILDRQDSELAKIQNVMTLLGLRGCKDVFVGDAMIRGISGGQKRRVTVGEMLVCPRPVR